MELEFSKDCPQNLKNVFETLISVKESIYNLIAEQLKNGECSHLSNDLYGYPYDYQLYSKDSLDPQVQSLNSLLEKVEETFEFIKMENSIK
jgi:hypothetical protein